MHQRCGCMREGVQDRKLCVWWLCFGGGGVIIDGFPINPCVLPFLLLQVRWYSFQFVMDELVEELEEAYLSVSIVLDQLPHPIR